MAASTNLNKNNSAVKRIMQEARELANDPCTDYAAAPLEDDIFEWHCTIRGPAGTEFEGGLYHFRILLPAEYPFRPPSLMMLTPNGRFELNSKICISFTSYHEEMWQPAWGVRTAILGLQGFFPLKGSAAAGVASVEYPPSERRRLAALSKDWACPRCEKSNRECLPDPPPAGGPSSSSVATVDKPETEPKPDDQTETAPAVPPSSDVPDAPTIAEDVPQVPEPAMRVATRPDTSEKDPSTSSLPSLSISSSHSGDYDPPPPVVRTAAMPTSTRPPLLLDTAICVLLVLVFALICRRLL